ncbi:hypothetical protein AK812_SmicGene1161 [Symbiodinium microadriaticum]|uniref:Uncharacterized protein n=1 Tax=Symbiodinium microadriaticum TaxID=2951 RepID=A0A1Q9F4P3_SYMMI|nr:hypothetical protein AK812_SmicGene1161 [Symbiodinium microadriaticum]CAE7254984.1 unnamed protein product [Symbiodinium microadriaticum]
MDALQTAVRGVLAEWMAGLAMKDEALYVVLVALCMVLMVVHLLSHRRTLGRLVAQLSQQDAVLQTVMGKLKQVEQTTAAIREATSDGWSIPLSQQDATLQTIMDKLNQVEQTTAAIREATSAGWLLGGSGSASSDQGSHSVAVETAVKELAGMHAQFFLTCEDIKSLCTTAQYTCDFCAAQARVLYEIQTEMEDLVRSHVALTMAVNQLLSKVTDHMLAGDGSTPADVGASVPADTAEPTTRSEGQTETSAMVSMLRDALEPPVTRLKHLRDAVESGLSGVSTQLVELQTLTAVQKTQYEKVAEELGKVDRATSKLITASGETQESLTAIKAAGERHRQDVEKVEMTLRAKTTSLAEDANAMDSSTASLATIGGALSRPPIDSAGVLKLQDSFMSLSELVKELEVHMSTLIEGVGAVDAKLGDLKERLPEKPPYRTPPAESPQVPRAPQVIDLQSRIPFFRPVSQTGPGIATVTYSDGTQQAIREETLRGFVG